MKDARAPSSHAQATLEKGSAARARLGPISVVIVNYNGEAHLEECLRAVGTLRGDVAEVIVVDNASTDRSLAIAAEALPHARVVRMERNDGPAPARNAGMRAAKNRWVLALDNDAIVGPDTLEKLEAAVRDAPPEQRVAIAQPRSVFHSEPSRVHYDGGSFHYVGLISLRNFYVPIAEAEGAGVVPVDCAVSVALLVDRDLLMSIGGYDETFFILFEDLDLSYRLRSMGHTILSVEDAIVLHRGGTPGISYREGPKYPSSRVFYHSRNRWLFLAKNYRAWTLFVSLPGLALYEVVWFAFAVASGGMGAWLRGKAQCVQLASVVLRERRAARSNRRVGDGALLKGSSLTLTPSVATSAGKRAVLRALDRALAAWWWLVGWSVPTD